MASSIPSLASPDSASDAIPELLVSTSNHTLRASLRYLHNAYPLVLLIFFLSAFTLRGIRSSLNDSRNTVTPAVQTGPGGKPLPTNDPLRNVPKRKPDDIPRSQKHVFEWLSAAAALTFVGNAINVIVHALYSRKDSWWCGQAYVVSCPKGAALPDVHANAAAFTRSMSWDPSLSLAYS